MKTTTTTPTGTADGTPTATERANPGRTTPRIGGSLHGRPYRLGDDLALVAESNTTWLHAFLDVREKYEQDVNPRDDPDIVALRRASRELGAKLIVSLQWNFIGIFGKKEAVNVPASGSDRERALFEYATELLTAIGQPTDIVVLGNEPIWEALDEDVQGKDLPLVPFTRDLKEHLVEHFAGEPRLLLGAFNRLYDGYVTRAYGRFHRQLFEMARTDDDIDGIDLHVHYDGFDQAETMLTNARKEFPDGTIVVTEFSPVWRYDRHKDDPITSFEGGDRFADRYGISEDTTVMEYFEAAKEDPRSPDEMAEFMEAMPWYNVTFVEDMYDLLGEYDVDVGTFGFLLDTGVRHTEWTSDWQPFHINFLFQPGLIDSEYGAHPLYLDDYRERA